MADTAGFTAAVLCCACGGGARSTACPISDTTPLFKPCRCAAGVTNECPAGSYCLPSGVCALAGGRVVIGDAFLGKDIGRMLIGEPAEAPSLKSCAVRCLGDPRCKAVGFGVSAGEEGSPSPERLSILSDGRRKGSCALLRAANTHPDYAEFIPSPRWRVHKVSLQLNSTSPEVLDVPDAARAFSSSLGENLPGAQPMAQPQR